MYNASAMKRPGLKRKPSRAVERLRRAAAASANGAPANGAAPNGTPARPPAKVVSLLEPDLVLERTARRFLSQPIDRCVKCDSTFVGREPAFIHCFYCGKMARIANASLLAQEEFEMRSGLRIAV
ncbi:MAG: hypothetical protein DMD80_21165 [Candidatus Rokuibacteriota bacterium]|nr:MAG: hypothetical protein DMD80_21165 [Candidatus Rokubacteria bacterium]